MVKAGVPGMCCRRSDGVDSMQDGRNFPMLSRLFNDFFKGHSPAKHPSKLAAEAARTRGDWPAAKAAYRLYLVDHPDDAEAQNDLGTIHCELGEFDQAQVAFSTAIRLDQIGRAHV